MATPDGGAARYRADQPACRIVVEAEGMALVYHRPSGATHVLLPPAPEILEILSEAAADAAGIAAALVARYAAEADEPVGEIVSARLAELKEAGLVARA